PVTTWVAPMLLAPALALALLAAPPATDDTVDISAVRDGLRALDDGHDHFLVLVPFGDMYEHFYWGDGKDFWAIQVFGGMQSGNESFERNFWAPPRLSAPTSLPTRNARKSRTRRQPPTPIRRGARPTRPRAPPARPNVTS